MHSVILPIHIFGQIIYKVIVTCSLQLVMGDCESRNAGTWNGMWNGLRNGNIPKEITN